MSGILLSSGEIIYVQRWMHNIFWYMTMLELQLSCENVARWVRHDPRFSGYLKQVILKYAMATFYIKDGQEVIPEGK